MIQLGTDWTQHIKSFELNDARGQCKFKFTCFGVTRTGDCNVYGQGMTPEQAINNMLVRAKDRSTDA